MFKLLLYCQVGNIYCLVCLFNGLPPTLWVCWPLSCSNLTCFCCKKWVWRLLIKVELLSYPSWSLKDVCNIGVQQKLKVNIFPDVSVTWCYVVFVKAVWPIFGHAEAVRPRVLTLVIQVNSQHSSCGICGRQSNASTGSSPNNSILSC